MSGVIGGDRVSKVGKLCPPRARALYGSELLSASIWRDDDFRSTNTKFFLAKMASHSSRDFPRLNRDTRQHLKSEVIREKIAWERVANVRSARDPFSRILQRGLLAFRLGEKRK